MHTLEPRGIFVYIYNCRLPPYRFQMYPDTPARKPAVQYSPDIHKLEFLSDTGSKGNHSRILTLQTAGTMRVRSTAHRQNHLACNRK